MYVTQTSHATTHPLCALWDMVGVEAEAQGGGGLPLDAVCSSTPEATGTPVGVQAPRRHAAGGVVGGWGGVVWQAIEEALWVVVLMLVEEVLTAWHLDLGLATYVCGRRG